MIANLVEQKLIEKEWAEEAAQAVIEYNEPRKILDPLVHAAWGSLDTGELEEHLEADGITVKDGVTPEQMMEEYMGMLKADLEVIMENDLGSFFPVFAILDHLSMKGEEEQEYVLALYPDVKKQINVPQLVQYRGGVYEHYKLLCDEIIKDVVLNLINYDVDREGSIFKLLEVDSQVSA